MDRIKSLLTPDGQELPTSQIKPGSKVFYPLKHPYGYVIYFSQWSDGGDVMALDVHQAILSRGEQVFECNIPVDRVVFGHRMFPAGTSTLVYERELIVFHPQADSQEYDQGLVCTLSKNTAYD